MTKPGQQGRHFKEYVDEAALLIRKTGSLQRGALGVELDLSPTMIDRILEAVLYQAKGSIVLVREHPRDYSRNWVFTKPALDGLKEEIRAHEEAEAARYKAEEEAERAAERKAEYERAVKAGRACICGMVFDSHYTLIYEHIKRPGDLDLSRPHGEPGKPPQLYQPCSCGYVSVEDWEFQSHLRAHPDHHQAGPETIAA